MAENERRKRSRTFAERLYKRNVLPKGNLIGVPSIDQVIVKLENPPVDNEEEGTL